MGIRIVREAPDADQEDADLLGEFIAAKRNLEQAERHYRLCQEALANSMETRHQKSVTHTFAGKAHTATYVQKNTIKVDEKGLRRALTAKVYDKYTEKKLNRSLLEDAMGTGQVDPMVVAKYIEQVPGAAYIRYTEKEVTDE